MLDRLNEYIEALKDVSVVDNFQSKWEAVGLKQFKMLENSKVRTLTIDTKAFTKCNFWAVAKGSAIMSNLPMLQPRSWNGPGRTTLQSAY